MRIADRHKTFTLRLLAEVGVQAKTFPSAAQLTSWVGTCPGKEEGGKRRREPQQSFSKRKQIPAAGAEQAAHAAARKKGSYFQAVFRRLLPRLGYKSAIWAIADRLCRVVWKILHEGVRFIELEQPGFRRTSGVVNEATRTYCRQLRRKSRRRWIYGSDLDVVTELAKCSCQRPPARCLHSLGSDSIPLWLLT